MKKEFNITFNAGMIFFWTVVSFFIIFSPLSRLIYFPLAFGRIDMPLFYWLWVILGALFLMLAQKKSWDAAKIFILTAILFHLELLMAELSTDSALYTDLAGPYRLYVYSFIYGATFLLFLWSIYPLIGSDFRINLFLPRIPLTLAPFFCFFYSMYRLSTAGIVIFGSCAISCLAAISLKKRLERIILSISGVLRRIKENREAIAFCIFLLAFFARLAFSVNLIAKTGGDYITASDDGYFYDTFATAIVNQPEDMMDILVKKSSWPPAYIVFLSAIYKLFGRNFYIVALIQSLLGASVAFFIYLIGKNTFDENTGLIAGFLVALNQPLIFLSATLHTEAIYLPLLSLGIFLFLDGFFYNYKGIYLKMALSGIAFALGSLTFPVLVIFPSIAAFFAVFNKTHVPGKRLKIAAIFFISFIIALFSVKCILALKAGTWVTRYELNGRVHWQMGRSTSGAEQKEWREGKVTLDSTYKACPDNREFIAMGIDPYKPAESLRIAATNWKKVLGIVARTFPARIRNFFFWTKFGSFDPIFLTARIPSSYIINLEFYTATFFFIGLVMSFFIKESNKKGAIIFILLFMAYQIVIHSMIFAPHRMRYSCPVKLFLIMFCAYGLSVGMSYFKKAIQNSKEGKI